MPSHEPNGSKTHEPKPSCGSSRPSGSKLVGSTRPGAYARPREVLPTRPRGPWRRDPSWRPSRCGDLPAGRPRLDVLIAGGRALIAGAVARGCLVGSGGSDKNGLGRGSKRDRTKLDTPLPSGLLPFPLSHTGDSGGGKKGAGQC
eukprot:6494567-Pyramimonas_sp.AAC.1